MGTAAGTDALGRAVSSTPELKAQYGSGSTEQPGLSEEVLVMWR